MQIVLRLSGFSFDHENCLTLVRRVLPRGRLLIAVANRPKTRVESLR